MSDRRNSTGDVKSPSSPLTNVSSLISQSNKKALKQAFLITIAIVFALLILISVSAVYLILQPFIQPLVWATLIGSVLHPLKLKLTKFTNWWLQDKDKRPISFSVIKMPWILINYVENLIVSVVHEYYKLFIFIAFLTIILTNFFIPTLTEIIRFIMFLIFNARETIYNLISIYLLIFLISSLFIFRITSPESAVISFLLQTSLVFSLLKVLQMMGDFDVLIVVGFCSIIITGLIASKAGSPLKKQSRKSLPWIKLSRYVAVLSPLSKPRRNSNWSILRQQLTSKVASPNSESTSEVDGMSSTSFGSSDYKSDDDNGFGSVVYIYAIFWSCLLAQIWMRPYILILISILSTPFLLSRLWKILNNQRFFPNWCDSVEQFFNPIFVLPKSELVDKIKSYYSKGDAMIAHLLLNFSDCLCSLITILSMFILVVFAIFFFSFEIYQESAYIVEMTSDAINSTIVNNQPYGNNFTAKLFKESLIDEFINKSMNYGRQWLQKSLQNTIAGPLGNGDHNLTEAIESVTMIWEKVYKQWLEKDTKSDSNAITNRSLEDFNWDKLLAALQKLDYDFCVTLVKKNFGTLVSIFDSVWMFFKNNLNLVVTLITAFFSLILSGSTVILNSFLNFIIFGTSLFYLLCYSGEKYKPVEFVEKFVNNSESKGNHSSKFFQGVEESIKSVFIASLKMAIFYGLYTWLIHTIFDAKIVYIPSVIAALFGAIPFIGAYWASVPAVLSLYIFRGMGIKSLLMFFIALLPSYFVDSAIYSDIKGGGHPYLIGLAIAGGVFYLGFSGAFFGPMILCCLFEFGKLYKSIMIDNPRRDLLK